MHWLARMDSHAPKLVVPEEFGEKSEHSSGGKLVVGLVWICRVPGPVLVTAVSRGRNLRF